jgi:hypothetical protein
MIQPRPSPCDPGWARFAGRDSRVTRIRLGGMSPGDLTELAGALGLGALSPCGARARGPSPVTGAFPVSRP